MRGQNLKFCARSSPFSFIAYSDFVLVNISFGKREIQAEMKEEHRNFED
jgi:hypothetical protein